MRIKWGSDNGRDLTITCDEPGRWEATPKVGQFRLQQSPVVSHPDRLAVAASLLFGDLFNGMLRFPTTINLVTASAIRDYCYPGEVFIGDIDDGPKAILTGSGELDVSDNLIDLGREMRDFDSRLIVDLPSNTYTGAIASHRSQVVASNSSYFNRDGQPNGKLAVAVLVAASLDVNIIRCPVAVSEVYATRVTRLLSSVGLGVDFSGDLDG